MIDKEITERFDTIQERLVQGKISQTEMFILIEYELQGLAARVIALEETQDDLRVTDDLYDARKVAQQLYFRVIDMNPRDSNSKCLRNLHPWLSKIEEGEHCIWLGCDGILGYNSVVPEQILFCNKCGWKEPKND